MDVVFSRAWFKHHQRSLVGLLNAPGVGYAMREVLGIGFHGCNIMRITPYEVTARTGERKFSTEFHIDRAFGVRMHQRFRSVWDLCHWFDEHIANPYVPALNLGFDTLTARPQPDPESETVDGYFAVSNGPSGVTYSAIRGGAAAVTAFPSAQNGVGVRLEASGTASGWRFLNRSAFVFNTSSIGAGKIVTDATLSIYTDGVTGTNIGNSTGVNIYGMATASNTDLVSGDWASFGSTAFSDGIPYSSWSGGYRPFALNASGISALNLTGLSKFSAMESGYDGPNNTPPWSSLVGISYQMYFADDTTAENGKDPKLVVTYTVPVTWLPRVMIFTLI
jgi:hypothetical protein